MTHLRTNPPIASFGARRCSHLFWRSANRISKTCGEKTKRKTLDDEEDDDEDERQGAEREKEKEKKKEKSCWMRKPRSTLSFRIVEKRLKEKRRE
jgi:hypothetical protein